MDSNRVQLDGIVAGDELEQAYKKRNVKYLYKKVVKQDLQPFFDEGWEKTGYRHRDFVGLRKLKEVASGFEDEVWCIFKRMGFQEMNKDGSFSIPRYDTSVSKQVDVFAKDDQCICIIECKSAEKVHTKRSLDVFIDQMAGIRHCLELSIFSHYRDPENLKKLKTVWILAIKNIDVSENDRERARQSRIRIMDDNQIEYYSELSSHFGRSSKFQFLADMLPGIEIPELIEPVAAIRGTMGKYVFYSFVLEPEKLLKIAYISHRARTNEETIKTYQRMAKKSRLKRIAEHIHNREGIFPTSIVINIETERPLRFDVAAEMAGKNAVLGTLYIPNKYKTAWIIDGQHRLFAYSDLDEATTATLPVIAFENLDPEVQANLFVDINGEQVRVAKNLLVDLWATLHWNSTNPREQLKALTSRLVKELNVYPESPLRDRIINIGGRKTKTRNITMTALAEEIQKRQLLGNVDSPKSKTITPGPLYVDDMDSTLIRARDVISGYFGNYIDKSEILRRQWEIGSGEGGYVCTNGGLIALLRILKAILDHIEHKDTEEVRKTKPVELVQKVWKYQQPVCKFLETADSKTIQEFRGRYGEGGFSACTNWLLWEINKVYNNFDPAGLQQWIKSQSTVNNPRAYDIVSEIESDITRYVMDALKKQFGEDIGEWWHQGVPDKVKQPAMQRAVERGDYRHPERFVDFIHWEEIISENMELLGNVFTIDSKPNESKKKRFSWLVKVNDIRDIVAHPPRGGVTDAQVEYVTRIRDELKSRLSSPSQD